MTRMFPVRAMGKKSEQLSAARQFHADQPRTKTAREECEEGDDAEALAMDAWAECMIARGVARRVALQCAADIMDVQRAKDAACASAAGYGGTGSELGGRSELLEGLREIGIKIYQAAKRGMEAGALVLATGSAHRDFKTARELAERQHVSHELTANAVEEWQRLLGLPRTSGQKSEEAKHVYNQTNGRIDDEQGTTKAA